MEKLRNVLRKHHKERENQGKSVKKRKKLEIKMNKLSRKIGKLTVLQDPDTGDLNDPEEEGGDEDTGEHDARIFVPDPEEVLLDISTAANNIRLSDDLKTATWTKRSENRPETAERFQEFQVMSSRGFSSGRHYWDLEVRRSGWWWKVGMCYSSILRKGEVSHIGNNNQSWAMLCGGQGSNNQCFVTYDDEGIWLPYWMSSDRFRITLDYEGGKISLYELCDPITHIYTFNATFTEPLHVAIWLNESSVKILGGGRIFKEPS